MTRPPPPPVDKTERIPADVRRVFELEPHGPDTWVGESPVYPWGRIYGGLTIAQGLWAAMQTVAPEHVVHSLHGYFILGGDPAEPVRYEVDRIRNGRSFTTRHVVARQSAGAIFDLACSFQRYEEGIETQTVDFPVAASPPPTAGEQEGERAGERAIEQEGSGVERCEVALAPGEPRSLVWARYPIALGDDARLHACALAYLSDTNAMEAIGASHPQSMNDTREWHEKFMSASLDHALWFHRPARADEWLLFDLDGHGIIRTRGLSTGHVFSAAGDHVATIAQEGLIRLLA